MTPVPTYVIDGKYKLESEITHVSQAAIGTSYWRVVLKTGEVAEVHAFETTLWDGRTFPEIARVGATVGDTYPFSYCRIFADKRDAQRLSRFVTNSLKRRCEVTENADGSFQVTTSGGVYTVTAEAPERMNENVYVYTCNCPAAQHGGDCKHVSAVISFVKTCEEYE